MDRTVIKSLIFGLAAGAMAGGMIAIGASLGFTSFSTIWPVMVTCAVVGVTVHNAKQTIAGMTDNRTRTLRNRMERIRRDIGDIHGLVRLSPYTQDLPLPIGGGWALTGDAAAILAREVLVRKPETILELGSGVSTLILGQILKRNGRGRLLSVDHDTMWANQTRRYIEFLGLQHVVSVLDAPLKELTLDKQMVEWYDIPTQRLDELGTIDLLLVDGPPQAKGNPTQARYPAFPILRERLSPAAFVFVDDAKRETEKRMIERWMREYPGWYSQCFDTLDGVCLLTKIPQSLT